MAYGQYPNSYYQNPYIQQQQTIQQPQSSPFNWVSGEVGAKSYLVAPGNSVLLMDSEENKFYIKSADASGMPLPLRKFKYEEVSETPQNAPESLSSKRVEYVTREEYNALCAKIEALTAMPQKKEEEENA